VKNRKPTLPYLLVSDGDGNIFEIKELWMCGKTLSGFRVPEPDEVIPLPYGSDLYMLPDRAPVGYDYRKKRFIRVDSYNGERVYGVAAFVAPAYMQYYIAPYEVMTLGRDKPRTTRSFERSGITRLPLYCYSPVGWKDGTFFTTGIRIDRDKRQDLKNFDLKVIEERAQELLKNNRKNRLIEHLVENCVFRYGCPAARNFVMGRWECPLPTSPYCNAKCVGCISEQGGSGVPCSQERIKFVPEVWEVVDVATRHLENAPYPVVSFGQGCEGEPLMVAELLHESILQIRKKTNRGVINLNTNGSKPEVVEKLCRAGLDSIRVSINSAQEEYYRKYYRPSGYDLGDVIETLKMVKKYGKWASINYLIFPGFTDHPLEIDALKELVKTTGIDMIQTRNLNIDPDWYIEELGLEELPPDEIGLPKWVKLINKNFPDLKLGYFNPPAERMKNWNIF